MGNCLRHHKNISRTKPDDPEPEPRPGSGQRPDPTAGGQGETSTKGSESKVVRIKVVVSRDELRAIMDQKDAINSVEHLVRALKQRARKISRVHDGEEMAHRNWRPTLDSIPENCY